MTNVVETTQWYVNVYFSCVSYKFVQWSACDTHARNNSYKNYIELSLFNVGLLFIHVQILKITTDLNGLIYAGNK